MGVLVATEDEVREVEREGNEHDAVQDAELASLAERVDALEARPAPTVTAPRVGAYVGAETGTVDYPGLWRAAQRSFGPLHIWRCFDSTIKAPASARYAKVPGPTPFYSLKPPNADRAGFAAGQYVTAYQTVVSGLPQGSYLAVWHEPEDDMTGDQFAALTERAYADAKAVRPDLTFCYAAMAYQWETNSQGNVGSSAGWLDAAKLVDLVTVDVYANDWHYWPLATDAGMARWLDEIAAASGRPWGISERGIDSAAGENARIDMLMDDWLFACQHGAQMMLYWQANWTTGNWALTGATELAAMGRIAAQGNAARLG
jgi:hypothetical protein